MSLAANPQSVKYPKMQKTEPPVQAAPSPICVDSIHQTRESCQSTNNRPENGEPVSGLPRLPSVSFSDPETGASLPEEPLLGKSYDLSNPPQSKILAAFKMLKPLHKLYLDDFTSDDPVLNHGSSGWPHRSAFCYEHVLPSHHGVELRRSMQNEHSVSLGQVMRCGAIHLCPVCGLFAALRWQQDIEIIEQQLRDEGYRLLLFVLTISHTKDDRLADELDILRAAYGELFGTQKKSQKKRAKRWGIDGRLRAWDVLYGDNGWHAHVNVMIAIKPDHPDFSIETIHEEYDRLYRKVVQDAGGFASMDHGLKVEEYANGKCYMVKTGMEHLECVQVGDRWNISKETISAGGKKASGYSIGELRSMLAGGLGLSADGHHVRSDRRISLDTVRAKVLEYGVTMTGERMVVTGGVIRDKVRALRGHELTDQEASAMLPDTVSYTVDGVIPAEDYRRVIIGEDHIVDLIAALRAGKQQVTEYLASVGIVLDARDISREYYHQDCIQIVDERDRDRVVQHLDRHFEQWSILNDEKFTKELDEFQ